MYDYNYTAAAEMGYDAAMANRPSFGGDLDDSITCDSRDFNRTQYQSTVVTEVSESWRAVFLINGRLACRCIVTYKWC